MGNQNFFGPAKNVDTTKPFTVVTQFVTTDGTANGDLAEIRRVYVQNGKVIPNSAGMHRTLPLPRLIILQPISPISSPTIPLPIRSATTKRNSSEIRMLSRLKVG